MYTTTNQEGKFTKHGLPMEEMMKSPYSSITRWLDVQVIFVCKPEWMAWLWLSDFFNSL